ncbi:hypothetical protein R5K42_15295 [Acinetobacter baumannii]|nr:hypothetical protein [Acinetobacter baumannii]MDW2794733.1 hypothetical protein [Acinetobacter baumannii]
MAQESRLVIVIDSQNAERNARNLGNELVSIERKGEFASKSKLGWYPSGYEWYRRIFQTGSGTI